MIFRNSHTFACENKFPEYISLEEIENNTLSNFFTNEKNYYKQYLKHIENNGLHNKFLWWPKIFINLKYDTFEEYLQLLDYITTNKFFEVFDNDGWILMNKKFISNKYTKDPNIIQAYKIKPKKSYD